jgi:hypothetical protein
LDADCKDRKESRRLVWVVSYSAEVNANTALKMEAVEEKREEE